jgi:uncharacterized protein (DUF433 family)
LELLQRRRTRFRAAGGIWTFRETRVPVRALFENIEGGATVDQFVEWFPGVMRRHVEAVLEHAARSLIEV